MSSAPSERLRPGGDVGKHCPVLLRKSLHACAWRLTRWNAIPRWRRVVILRIMLGTPPQEWRVRAVSQGSATIFDESKRTVSGRYRAASVQYRVP